jgi:hypothetical protein
MCNGWQLTRNLHDYLKKGLKKSNVLRHNADARNSGKTGLISFYYVIAHIDNLVEFPAGHLAGEVQVPTKRASV